MPPSDLPLVDLPIVCPNCDKTNVAHKEVKPNAAGGYSTHPAQPQPGCVLMCLFCGVVYVLDGGAEGGHAKTHVMTEAEEAEMQKQDPAAWEMLQVALAARAVVRMQAHAAGRPWGKGTA